MRTRRPTSPRRLTYDKKRDVLWQTLTHEFFSQYIDAGDTVVELGAGWCDFINNVEAKRRIAVDLWPGIADRVGPGVEAIVSSATDLSGIETNTVNVVFASNLLEHLTHEQIDELLDHARRILVPGGRLILVQPNYRLCAKNYFDDFTHVSVWSDIGMSTFLESRGWELEEVQGRFLPLTVKSRLPVSSKLISAYLRSPIKPLAGQMLLIAKA
jgi:ubiquinone/menaquinone biosynthesis C-methylase UbiE